MRRCKQTYILQNWVIQMGERCGRNQKCKLSECWTTLEGRSRRQKQELVLVGMTGEKPETAGQRRRFLSNRLLIGGGVLKERSKVHDALFFLPLFLLSLSSFPPIYSFLFCSQKLKSSLKICVRVCLKHVINTFILGTQYTHTSHLDHFCLFPPSAHPPSDALISQFNF